MKHWLLAAALICLGSSVQASPYFRFVNWSHPILSAGILIDQNHPAHITGVTDVALITHSTADGTLIPLSWQGIVPPEDWVPLQFGGGYGGGKGIINTGTSLNMAPPLTAILLGHLKPSGFKDALMSGFSGSGNSIFAFGPSLVATPVVDGTLLPINQWIVGRGIGAILNNSLRWEVQGAWRF